MMKAIDTKLIAAYQWVVDVSQRRREWWVEQCGFGYVIASAISEAVRESGPPGITYVILFLALVIGASILLAARVAAALALFQLQGWRVAMLVATAILCLGPVMLGALFGGLDAHDVTRAASGVIYVSVYYFASCEPPAPPRKREEHKLGFAP